MLKRSGSRFKFTGACNGPTRSKFSAAAIVESSDDAIFTKSLDGVIQTWNRAAERLYGYDAAEIIGQPVTNLVPLELLDEFQGIMRRIRTGIPVEHLETFRKRKDDSVVEVSVTISPICDASGDLIGASTIARDISHRRRTEKALRDRAAELIDIFDNSPIGITQ